MKDSTYNFESISSRSSNYQAGSPPCPKFDYSLQSLSIFSKESITSGRDTKKLEFKSTTTSATPRKLHHRSPSKRAFQSKRFESNVFKAGHDSNTLTKASACKRNRSFCASTPSGPHAKRKKRVTFSPRTKTHDGLCESSLLLDELIYTRANNPTRIASPRGLVEFVNSVTSRLRSHQLIMLEGRLSNLLQTMDNNQGQPVRVLPNGGGRNQIFISSPINIRCIRQLQRLCKDTHARLVRLYQIRFGSLPTAINLNQTSMVSPVHTAIASA